jgi:protoheme IX farnesyltransferase
MQNKILNNSYIKDYWTLTKPNVIFLMLITALIGMLVAPHHGAFPVLKSIIALIGIALSAAGAAVINHLADKKIDIHMRRTEMRPIAQGRIDDKKALLFAGILGVSGLALLEIYVNSLTTWLTFLSQMGYAVLYTRFLKHATHQNIVIGGLAGATPPLLGQVAISGQIEPLGLMLALIIFTWTPPHFWALAIHRHKDYAKAKVPMLPVTHGIFCTKICILLYTILLIIVTLLPYLTGDAHEIYLLSAIGLGVGYLYYAIKLLIRPTEKLALGAFLYSIFYLFALFLGLLSDFYLIR